MTRNLPPQPGFSCSCGWCGTGLLPRPFLLLLLTRPQVMGRMGDELPHSTDGRSGVKKPAMDLRSRARNPGEFLSGDWNLGVQVLLAWPSLPTPLCGWIPVL